MSNRVFADYCWPRRLEGQIQLADDLGHAFSVPRIFCATHLWAYRTVDSLLNGRLLPEVPGAPKAAWIPSFVRSWRAKVVTANAGGRRGG